MSKITWYYKILIEILKSGPIPKHVAFIMDGNRRFSVKHSIEKKEAHVLGLKKMFQVVHYCQLLGIEEVTTYAFSVDNFKRTKEEVDTIMQMLLDSVLESIDNCNRLNVRVRFFGNYEMIPGDVLQGLKKIAHATCENTKLTLNLAFAYSSRHEMVNSMRIIHAGVRNGEILLDDVDEELIGRALMINNRVDVLMRTSEVRLSDFLLWQVATGDIFFCKAYWPELNFFNFMWYIFLYQRNYAERVEVEKVCANNRVEAFLKKVNEERMSVLFNDSF